MSSKEVPLKYPIWPMIEQLTFPSPPPPQRKGFFVNSLVILPSWGHQDKSNAHTSSTVRSRRISSMYSIKHFFVLYRNTNVNVEFPSSLYRHCQLDAMLMLYPTLHCAFASWWSHENSPFLLHQCKFYWQGRTKHKIWILFLNFQVQYVLYNMSL